MFRSTLVWTTATLAGLFGCAEHSSEREREGPSVQPSASAPEPDLDYACPITAATPERLGPFTLLDSLHAQLPAGWPLNPAAAEQGASAQVWRSGPYRIATVGDVIVQVELIDAHLPCAPADGPMEIAARNEFALAEPLHWSREELQRVFQETIDAEVDYRFREPVPWRGDELLVRFFDDWAFELEANGRPVRPLTGPGHFASYRYVALYSTPARALVAFENEKQERRYAYFAREHGEPQLLAYGPPSERCSRTGTGLPP